MAATINMYYGITEALNKGTIDPDNDSFKLVLLKSTYTPNLAHVQLADLVLATNEFSTTQFGYTAGGIVCAAGFTVNRTTNITTVSLANFSLVSTGGTLPVWRYYAIYADVTRNSLTGPLVCYGLGNDAAGGTDIGPKLDGSGWTLRWNASGLYRTQV